MVELKMDRQMADLLRKQAELTKQPFIENEITKRILEETGGEGLYHKHEFDLSVARTDEGHKSVGDRLMVETVDDAVTIKLNSRKNPSIDLQKFPLIKSPIKKFYITNDAGSGNLDILVGSEGMFEAKKKLEIIAGSKYLVAPKGSLFEVISGDTETILKRYSDATTAIQWAIDNLTSGRDYLETVLCKGSFSIATPVKIKDYTDLYIQGMFKLANGADDHVIETTGNCDYFSIRGGVIDGNHANNAGNIDGIHLVTNPTNGLIDRMIIRECNRHGVWTDSGLQLGILACKIVNNEVDGVNVDSEHTDIFNSWIESNGINAISMEASSTHMRVIGNSCSANGEDGIEVNGTEHILVGNTCSFNSVRGISGGGNSNHYIGCRCNNNAWYGLNLNNYRNVVTGCLIADNGAGTRDGMLVSGDFNIITNNIFRDSDGTHQVNGLELDATADDNICNNNIFYNNITNAYSDAGARNIINNVSLNAGVPGVGGNWITATRDGVIVRDTTNNKTYIYAGGGWREISAA